MRRNLLFYKSHHKLIPSEPVSFSEKVQWRILNDRRELIARGGDKLKMKEHAKASGANVKIPATLWFGTDIEAIMDVDWETDWVLKPTTGSGFNFFGRGSFRENGITHSDIKKWRFDDNFRVFGEWAYGESQNQFFIEERIPTLNGESPNDIRFFVFEGEVKLIQVDTPRADIVERRFYSADWTPLDVTQANKPLAPIVECPSNLGEMIEAASIIGADYDFIRVDLYNVTDGLYFGEITPYPTGGLAPYCPEEFDLDLGKHWNLPRPL